MIDIIYTALQPFNIPVKYVTRPALNAEGIAVSFHFYSERYSYYGDGEGVDFLRALQVDIFYKKDLNGLDRRIIEALKTKKIRFENAFDSDDSIDGVRLYHKVLTFNFLESEVMQ